MTILQSVYRLSWRKMPVYFICALSLMVGLCLIAPASVQANALQTRIKDIVDVEGVRDNMLVGYGLVVGLNGTGDSLNNSPFTEQSLIGMLERLGVNVRGQKVRTDNVAAVMVTATLPPFSRQGTRIDINVSSLADAEDLRGGTLLVTPLLGADGEVYAVAQGPVSTGSFSAKGDGASVVKGVPTAGRIPSGGLIERELEFNLSALGSLKLSLRNPDFTTAVRIADAVNAHLGKGTAVAEDPKTVRVAMAEKYRNDAVGLISEIEGLRVVPDHPAKIVIDEVTGTIVMGSNVRISTVAIAQGNLTIRITENPQVSQPNPFSEQGETVVVPRTDIEVDEDKDKRMTVVNEGVTLQELVAGLNALGVGPRDVISILQSIKAAGALQAELEIL